MLRKKTTKQVSVRKDNGGAVATIEKTPVSAQERRRMIAEAAFYKAARRGFIGGDPEQDWFEAEREINARLSPPE